jgi:hypothetical protein
MNRVTKSAPQSLKRHRPDSASFEDEDEYDKAPAVTTRSVSGAIMAVQIASSQKIFVWQSCLVTVFLKYHRENELNPNPWCKA